MGPYSQHLIFFVTYEWVYWARVFAPGRTFQPSLMLVRKDRDYLLKYFSTIGVASGLATNVRLGCKSQLGTNTSLLIPFVSYKESVFM